MTDNDFNFIDYRQFHEIEAEPWEEIYDDSLSLAENLLSILQQSIVLPNGRVQRRIAIAYILTPSVLAKVLPILFCWGLPGSGKSLLGYLASVVHGVPVCGSDFTPAALRRLINECKYTNQEQQEGEKPFLIILDDIDPSIFGLGDAKTELFRMFKYGYDRNTSRVAIAGMGRENVYFDVFVGKIVSSVHAIYSMPGFSEFERRCLVLFHKKFSAFTQQELLDEGLTSSFDPAQLLDLKGFSWTGFDNKFKETWNDHRRCLEWVHNRRALKSRRANYTRERGISPERWTISTDLLATGVTLGIWPNLIAACDDIAAYWQYYDSRFNDSQAAILKILRTFIEEETRAARAVNEALKSAGNDSYIPLEISPEKLKKRLELHQAKGELDLTPQTKTVVACMFQLGWRLDVGKWTPIR